MTEAANDTFPLPVGPKTLEMYGKVIMGKIKDDIFKIELIKKLYLTECILNR